VKILSLLSVFFFQAEDGIRDKLVTGVQTCALPISDVHVLRPRPRCLEHALGHREPEREVIGRSESNLGARAEHEREISPHGSRRSEERRVGKEGRTRWPPNT